MRRAASIVLVLLLPLGSPLFGQGHVHTTPHDHRSGVLHVDHVHIDTGHRSHHSHPDLISEVAAEHPGHDAVTLGFSSTQAVPKRQLPGLVVPAAAGGAPLTEIARAQDQAETQPPHPPQISRPPGRAPPA